MCSGCGGKRTQRVATGKARGYIWPEDLCNVCPPSQMESHCDFGMGSDPFRGAECNDNLCTDKCSGMHDAAQATLVGAQVMLDHEDHYGKGFADFQNPTGGIR